MWTFCSRRSNNLINKLQEKALRVVYNDYYSSLNELLEIAIENTIHITNIHILRNLSILKWAISTNNERDI